MCLPWYDHVHRSTRESSHAHSHGELDIHGTLRPSHCGGVWAANVRLLPLWSCLSMSAPGVCFKGVSHSCRLDVGPAAVSCVHVRIFPPDTCRTQRTTGHGDPVSGRRGGAPLELDGWSRGLGSSHGDCERLPRLPSTAKSRNACNVTVRVLKCNCLYQRGGCSDT